MLNAKNFLENAEIINYKFIYFLYYIICLDKVKGKEIKKKERLKKRRIKIKINNLKNIADLEVEVIINKNISIIKIKAINKMIKLKKV